MEHCDNENARLENLKITNNIWKARSKIEKQKEYIIKKYKKNISIPKETLENLIIYSNFSEFELKLYLIFNYYQIKFNEIKDMTYADIREIFNLKLHATTNKMILDCLTNLKQLGLIDFVIKTTYNSRGASIPSFKIVEVNSKVKTNKLINSCTKQ